MPIKFLVLGLGWVFFGRGGGNANLFCWVLFAKKSAIAREFLLKNDTSLAIAMSGLRTNLLLQEPPLPKTPIRFSRL